MQKCTYIFKYFIEFNKIALETIAYDKISKLSAFVKLIVSCKYVLYARRNFLL